MKNFETKFASTDFKVNFLNLKKIKKFFLEKNRFFKKLIRNFNLPDKVNLLIIIFSDNKFEFSLRAPICSSKIINYSVVFHQYQFLYRVHIRKWCVFYFSFFDTNETST